MINSEVLCCKWVVQKERLTLRRDFVGGKAGREVDHIPSDEVEEGTLCLLSWGHLQRGELSEKQSSG